MVMMMSPIKCIARTRKERARRMMTTNMPTGKLPYFDMTNFAKWKHLMRAYLVGLYPAFGRLCAMDLSHPLTPRIQPWKK
jgi:hypothetical protein